MTKKGSLKGRAIEAIKDLKENRNRSIWEELLIQNKDRMDEVAIEYRMNDITYREMFTKVDEYAMGLASRGFKKGDEVLACVSNTPEFIYLLLAASKMGCIFNSIGEWFDKDYLEEIIEKNKTGIIFVSDDNYPELKDVIDKSATVKEVLLFSLADSLPLMDGKSVDLFEMIDKKFKVFKNRFLDFARGSSKKMLWQEKFIQEGREYAMRELGIIEKDDPEAFRKATYAKVDLDDPFTVTYTSGTTDPGRPKATLHAVRSLSLLARFKKSDVSGMPEMEDVRVLAHIPSYVFAEISTSIIDPLYLGCTVIPEPIYDKEYFPYGIILNRPNMSAGSVGFWRNLGMKLLYNDTFKNVKCGYLYIPIVTGEAMGKGEEKFFNYVARKKKFGVDKLRIPTVFSIGGGTNEFTGIFVTLFKAYQNLLPKHSINKIPVGQTPLGLAEVEILDDEGYPVEIGESGEIVVDTECNMLGYYYQSELDANTKRKDVYGRTWTKMGAYGLKLDDMPHLEIKGRLKDTVELSNGKKYPLFRIDDLVAMDTKNILSSSVVQVHDDDGDHIVIHVEPQPRARSIKDPDDLIKSIVGRLKGSIPQELEDSIYIRIRSTQMSFPVAPSGKRATDVLVNECLEGTIHFREISEELLDEAKTFSLTYKGATKKEEQR